MNSILKFNGFDNQQAKVLMLLIADAKVKRTAVPGMLRVVGNLNPVISRLLKNKIKPSEDEIRQYVERHPASLASYILRLIEYLRKRLILLNVLQTDICKMLHFDETL